MQRQEAIDILARSREGIVSVVTMQSVAPWQMNMLRAATATLKRDRERAGAAGS